MSRHFIKEMLDNYRTRKPARFHMPGHKGSMNAHDVTEISVTDDLNNPQSYIAKAQMALGESYRSAESFFLVNGSTGGIHTMLKYAAMQSEYPILISRNSHKSIISGCMLFNIDTIIIEDIFDEEQQAFIFNQDKIISAINNTKLSAVVLTSVDYFGRVIDASAISRACKENNVLLLCDEAHGAHFHISHMLPDSALQYADICVHSPHKTLSALTQCSYIHISKNINTEKLKSLMYSLQTSSPSFLLMESMDEARRESDKMKKQWERRISEAQKICDEINQIHGMKAMGSAWAKNAGYAQKDATRLVIDISEIGSGLEISKILEEKYNIFMEMATFKYIVAILTPWDKKRWDRMLIKALKDISCESLPKNKAPKYPKGEEPSKRIKNTEKLEWEKVRFIDSLNKISAVSVGAYPPGVPLVMPGERMSQEIIDYMLGIERVGGSLFGVENGYISCIKEEH
ncbi:MAG: aminotransferase class I/II-fold pyridoxal phosphate-dependent enzyme [Eubacteriales bacterium]